MLDNGGSQVIEAFVETHLANHVRTAMGQHHVEPFFLGLAIIGPNAQDRLAQAAGEADFIGNAAVGIGAIEQCHHHIRPLQRGRALPKNRREIPPIIEGCPVRSKILWQDHLAAWQQSAQLFRQTAIVLPLLLAENGGRKVNLHARSLPLVNVPLEQPRPIRPFQIAALIARNQLGHVLELRIEVINVMQSQCFGKHGQLGRPEFVLPVMA